MQNGCDFMHHAIDSLLLHGLSVWPKWKILVNHTKGEVLARGVNNETWILMAEEKRPQSGWCTA
jgi:hypothetical protein